MTQETTKQEAVAEATTTSAATQPAKELDAQQAEGVGGGTDMCSPEQVSSELIATYDNLVDATSHIIESVATALK
jgi:hypothetical protein